jgi:hypothetical protein
MTRMAAPRHLSCVGVSAAQSYWILLRGVRKSVSHYIA